MWYANPGLCSSSTQLLEASHIWTWVAWKNCQSPSQVFLGCTLDQFIKKESKICKILLLSCSVIKAWWKTCFRQTTVHCFALACSNLKLLHNLTQLSNYGHECCENNYMSCFQNYYLNFTFCFIKVFVYANCITFSHWSNFLHVVILLLTVSFIPLEYNLKIWKSLLLSITAWNNLHNLCKKP